MAVLAASNGVGPHLIKDFKWSIVLAARNLFAVVYVPALCSLCHLRQKKKSALG